MKTVKCAECVRAGAEYVCVVKCFLGGNVEGV